MRPTPLLRWGNAFLKLELFERAASVPRRADTHEMREALKLWGAARPVALEAPIGAELLADLSSPPVLLVAPGGDGLALRGRARLSGGARAFRGSPGAIARSAAGDRRSRSDRSIQSLPSDSLHGKRRRPVQVGSGGAQGRRGGGRRPIRRLDRARTSRKG